MRMIGSAIDAHRRTPCWMEQNLHQCSARRFLKVPDCLAHQRSIIQFAKNDSESGNDYFGARYYASSMGRFMSPDPGKVNLKHLANPQKWNKYAYVLNNFGDV